MRDSRAGQDKVFSSRRGRVGAAGECVSTAQDGAAYVPAIIFSASLEAIHAASSTRSSSVRDREGRRGKGGEKGHGVSKGGRVKASIE
jgi:hypothetical protein